jgi:alpha-galactosidase
MSEVVTLGSLALRLPERGMPQFVSASFAGPARAARADGQGSGMDEDVPSAVFLPVTGMGFFGWPAILGHRDGTHHTLDFAGWSSARLGHGVRISARDSVADVSIKIELHAPGNDVVWSRVALVNEGRSTYTLDRCMAGSFLAPAERARVTSFFGDWGREFQVEVADLGRGLWLQENRRGRTSHDKFPAIVLRTASESIALHLGWSGNHIIAIDRLDDGRRLLHAGELFDPGEVRLAPGEAYVSPKVFVGDEPRKLQNYARSEILLWPGGKMRPRPVTLNTWEGVYWDHKLEALQEQATNAAELGVERFVLDDGWFGARDSDRSGLGDWFVDRRKYPHGLGPLIAHVTKLGMEFGIWVEPEMVNPDSDLYRAHPDWVLEVKGRPLLTSRHQLVLDLTRKDVTDYLFDRLDALLAEHPIVYIKWDMNRDLTHATDAQGRAAVSRQTRAVYALMDRLRAAYPKLEIESCASGGGRADFGILERTSRIWTSDCTDALERLAIQRGAAMFFPHEILGAHVSASPNHQTGRHHSLAFRAIVALAYHFGVELNPTELTADERNELRGWIALHKRLRPVLHGPRGQFNLAPEHGRYVWGAESKDSIVVFVAQETLMKGEQPPPLRVPLAQPADSRWRVAATHPARASFIRASRAQLDLLSGKTSFVLEALTGIGLDLPPLRPESAVVLELERIEKD